MININIIIQWITQIIIFILLANIIELLLPKTAMKKYLKLVIGLILLLIFLKPVFYIFTIDIKKELGYSIFLDDHANEKPNTTESLTEIQIKEIQASQDAYILEQLSIQLKALAQEPLLEEFQAEIEVIDFSFNEKEVISYEALTEVIVYIREPDQKEGVVTIIDDISILQEESDISEINSTHDHTDIEERLLEVWELENVKLTIRWRGGPS